MLTYVITNYKTSENTRKIRKTSNANKTLYLFYFPLLSFWQMTFEICEFLRPLRKYNWWTWHSGVLNIFDHPNGEQSRFVKTSDGTFRSSILCLEPADNRLFWRHVSVQWIQSGKNSVQKKTRRGKNDENQSGVVGFSHPFFQPLNERL